MATIAGSPRSPDRCSAPSPTQTGTLHEAHFSAEQSPASPYARVPCTHEHEEWPHRPEAAPCEGSQAHQRVLPAVGAANGGSGRPWTSDFVPAATSAAALSSSWSTKRAAGCTGV